MILNLKGNGKSLTTKNDILLNDFTILTGENGTGKTQLLHSLTDLDMVFHKDEFGILRDSFGNAHTIFPLLSEEGKELFNVMYSNPGFNFIDIPGYNQEQNNENILDSIYHDWMSLVSVKIGYNAIRGKIFENQSDEVNEIKIAFCQNCLTTITL